MRSYRQNVCMFVYITNKGSNTTTVLEPLLLYIIYNVHSPEFVAQAGGFTCCVAIAENNMELSETKPTEPLFLKNS